MGKKKKIEPLPKDFYEKWDTYSRQKSAWNEWIEHNQPKTQINKIRIS